MWSGLSRSDAGPETLTRAGAEVVRGDVNDLAHLRAAAEAADGVIHAAFNHDFANLKEHSESDRKVIETLGAALTGSDRPLVITSGTGLVRSRDGGPATETDDHATCADTPRAATEEAADALIAKGGRVMVMRLPQTHDARHQGRIALHIRLARQKGWVAYVGAGENRLPAAHVTDVARLYRLALERGQAGARYHAVAEEGVALRDIATVIGAGHGRAGQVDHAGRSVRVFRRTGGPRHERPRRLRRSDAPATGLESRRPGPADRFAKHGLGGGLGGAVVSFCVR